MRMFFLKMDTVRVDRGWAGTVEEKFGRFIFSCCICARPTPPRQRELP